MTKERLNVAVAGEAARLIAESNLPLVWQYRMLAGWAHAMAETVNEFGDVPPTIPALFLLRRVIRETEEVLLDKH